MSELLRGLDAQQTQAVTTDAAPLAVIAAAGSGKTTVLTRRIAHRVLTGSAEAAHVLALTFTRDAAAELRRRLHRLDIHEPIDAGTFHAVALRLLSDRALAANQRAPQVAPDRHRLVRECITELRLSIDPSGALADLDWARARMVAPDRYDMASREARRRSATPSGRFADLVRAYEALKRRRGVVDFDDLLVQVVDAFTVDRPWAEGVRWRYRHFFVDEAQDLNPLQHAMLEALRDGRADLCLVGDPRQAVYGWNGSDPRLLAEVELTYPGVTIIRLGANYRCTPQVVRAGAAVLHASGHHDDTQSANPDGAGLTALTFADERAEAKAIAAFVRDAVLHGSARRIAVLARTNEQLAVIERALTAVGVPTERSAGKSPLERALAVAYRLPRERLAEWVEHVFTEQAREARGVRDDPTERGGVDEGALQRRIAEEADRYLTAGQPGTFRAWVDERDPFADLTVDDHRDSVSLLTFHSAKGREWPSVVVAGLEEGLVPHSSAGSAVQLSEEARLLHVALTRAGEQLMVTRALSRGGRETRPSRWLDAVTTAGKGEPIVQPPQRPRLPPDPLAPYREWRTSVARAFGQPDNAVCSDRVLRSLADTPPTSARELAERLGITETAATRLRPLPHAV